MRNALSVKLPSQERQAVHMHKEHTMIIKEMMNELQYSTSGTGPSGSPAESSKVKSLPHLYVGCSWKAHVYRLCQTGLAMMSQRRSIILKYCVITKECPPKFLITNGQNLRVSKSDRLLVVIFRFCFN